MAATITLPNNLTIAQIKDIFAELSPIVSGESDMISIDSSNLDNIDSAGLQMLVKLKAMCDINGTDFDWTNCSDTVKTNAAKLGLTDLLNIQA